MARDEIGREETLAEKLRAHVEQCDAANALEHVASGGSSLPRQATARPPPAPPRGTDLCRWHQELYLAPFNEGAATLREMHHPLFVLKLSAAALEK